MGKKKDKKAIAKKSAKAQQRKKRKRKLRFIKTKKQRPTPQYFDQPAIEAIDAPPGFRTVSMSQAIMEYSKSIIKWDESASLDAMNKMLQFTGLIWNYGIIDEEGKVDQKSKKKILGMIEVIYEVDPKMAQELLDKFTSRKNELFPPEIQVKGSRYMFMRKEMTHLIAPFNYKQIELSDEIFPADENDRDFLNQLNELDQDILYGKDYEKWEEKYLTMEQFCKRSFSVWLKKKGVKEQFIQDFAFMATIFTNFIYRYAHDDVGTLSKVRTEYFEEFLFDHVLRKVIIKPHEHVEWPPVLKHFLRFLSEKGYFDDVGQHLEIIDDLEGQFIDILRERYS